MSLWIAAYDISRNGARTSVAKILGEYGRRVQLSVFELWLTPGQVKHLRHRVGRYLAKIDHFHLFPVDQRGDRQRISWQVPPNPYAPVIVIAPRGDRTGPLPGCRMLHIDQVKMPPPWNRLRRRIEYIEGEAAPRDCFPFTVADPTDPLGAEDWPIADNQLPPCT
jgi:CRISPR-associated endonuclease Cas2